MRFCYTFRSFLLFLCAAVVLVVIPAGQAAFAQWTQIGADIDGEASGDRLGRAVALSADGSRLAVGAPGNSDGGSGAGHVRVYDWNGSSWVQVGADIDGRAASASSGWSIALSSDGSRLAIGAYASDSYTGYVRVYDWNGSNWVQVGSDINGDVAEDRLGRSVDLSADGSWLAIGVPGNDAGHVRVYRWWPGPEVWLQEGADIDGEADGDAAGASVALSSDGTQLAVGATGNDDNGSYSGQVRVYTWHDGTDSWIQMGADINGEALNDVSGASVALSSDGTRLAIGAPYNGAGGWEAGHVRVYAWLGTTGTWLQVSSDIDGEGNDYAGTSVALSSDGSLLAVGAPGIEHTGSDGGFVRLYDWNGLVWPQVGTDIAAETAWDLSGTSVAMSADGSRLAVGAPRNDGNGLSAGHVRVFDSLVLLPVELVWFNAEADGQSAVLTWETASDIDNNGFEVQMKQEESSWQTHGFVTGYGTTPQSREYSYTAAGLSPGKYAFRLKQVRLDGRFGYSETLELDIDFAGDYFLGPVYPNPIVSQGKLRFAISGTEQVEIWVYDMLGRKTRQLYAGDANGGTVKTLEFTPDRLPPGQYLVRLESRGRSLVQPMVVVR